MLLGLLLLVMVLLYVWFHDDRPLPSFAPTASPQLLHSFSFVGHSNQGLPTTYANEGRVMVVMVTHLNKSAPLAEMESAENVGKRNHTISFEKNLCY